MMFGYKKDMQGEIDWLHEKVQHIDLLQFD